MSFNSILLVITCLMLVAIQVPAQESIESTASQSQEELDIDQIQEGIVGRIIVFGDVSNVKSATNQFFGLNQVPDESFMVSEEGGLANAFVYLKNAPAGLELPANNVKKTLKTIKHRFVPHAQIVRTGQPLAVINRDPEADNVRFSGFRNVVKLDITPPLAKCGQPIERVVKLDHPERLPIVVHDDIYIWKRAYILPLDHPFATLTDKNGAFTIQGLPPGLYDFTVWHEKIGYLERNLMVEVQKNEPSQFLLSYPSSKFSDTAK